MKTNLLTAYFVLSFYVFGCLVIENDVNYATWYQLDAGSFQAYHQSLEGLLRFFLFLPMGLQLLVNGLLVWLRPAQTPRWALVVALLLNAYIIAESLLVQVPLHQALERHYSTDRLDALLGHHRLFRLPAEVLGLVLNGWLLRRTLHAATPSAAPK